MGTGINGVQFSVYIAFLAAIFILGLILFSVFKAPVKFIAILVFNSVLGGLLLFVLNFVFPMLGIEIGVNLLTAAVVGVLGVPGLVLLIILSFIL